MNLLFSKMFMFSALFCAVFSFTSVSVWAADGFGERFTQEAPRAFSDPVDPATLDQIEPAAGEVVDDIDVEKKEGDVQNIISDNLENSENNENKAP